MAFVGLAFAPVPVFQVRAVDDRRLLLCSPVSSGDDILYFSINSIFNVPVQERWRVEPDGTLTTVQVTSTPAVMGYYGIEGYAPGDDGLVHGVPRDAHYREIRLKAGPRGQQRLVVRDQGTALYKMIAEGAVAIAAVHSVPRIAACRE